MTRRLCVVGGGPAGLSAAIHAARLGTTVVVLERNDQCGSKLLATGGGHCNLGNTRPLSEWPPLFGRHGRFIVPAFKFLPTAKLTRWFADMGVPTECRDGFHFFPADRSAKSVRDALLAEAIRLGVTVRLRERVMGLEVDGGRIRGCRLHGGETVAADTVIVAAGGRSYPATGSTGDGFALAEETGHRLRSPYPGLVGLRARNLSAELAGVVLSDSTVFFKARGRAETTGRGELLLTHGGVSGPAVLDMSASVAAALAAARESDPAAECVIRLQWVTGLDSAACAARIAEWRRRRGGAYLVTCLKELLPQRLARWLCAGAEIGDETTVANLRADCRDILIDLLTAFPAAIIDSEGWDKAMVTHGGVELSDVDPGTLESRVVRGLYFAGETLDVDGPCGGYNLHWAFASGALAGSSSACENVAPRS